MEIKHLWARNVPFFFIPTNQINQELPMQYAFAGAAPMGSFGHQTSQLSRLTERLRRIGRWFIDNLNQRGNP